MKKKLKKARLVRKYLEDHPAGEFSKILSKRQNGVGIYVLYSMGRVYYVGKSDKDMRRRVRQHMNRDRHKGKWDRFSFFQITKPMFLKEIETLLIHACHPEGNRKHQNFKKARNLAD